MGGVVISIKSTHVRTEYLGSMLGKGMQMKNILAILSLVASLFVSASSLQAQWVQTNGPYGGYITCFAFHDTTVFAGTNGGVYESTANSMNWVGVGLSNYYVRALAVSSNGTVGMNVFAGTDSGVFIFTSSGTGWTEVDSGLTNQSVRSFVVSGANVFAGTWGGGIFLSSDNGSSWNAVDSGLTNFQVMALAVSDTNLVAGTAAGIFVSNNNGVTWTGTLTSPFNADLVRAFAIESNGAGRTNLYAAINGGVELSTDNGKTWSGGTAIDLPEYVACVAVSDSDLYAGLAGYAGSYFFYRSTDNGTSWSPVGSFGSFDTYVNACAVVPNGVSGTRILAGTNGEGVSMSSDNGVNWTSDNSGIKLSDVSSLAATPAGGGGTNIFAGTFGEGVFLSDNTGASWRAVDSDSVFKSVQALGAFGTKVFAATYITMEPIDVQGLISTDNGTSWGDSSVAVVSSFDFSDSNLYAVGSYGAGGVFVWSDSSEAWNRIPCPTIQTRNCIAVSGNNLFLGGQGVSLSTDEGADWTSVSNGIPTIIYMGRNAYTVVVNALAIWGPSILAGTEYGGVYLSTNSGTSWTSLNSGLPTLSSINTFEIVGTNVFAGTSAGVFRLKANDTTWIDENDGLANTNVSSLVIDGTNLVAGTHGGGVWYRPLPELTSVAENDNTVPKSFTVQQNYPNPFNPTTTIRFDLREASTVEFEVFNILGQRIQRFELGRMSAGIYSEIVNMSRYASGTYFYRIKAIVSDGELFTATKKMLLLK